MAIEKPWHCYLQHKCHNTVLTLNDDLPNFQVNSLKVYFFKLPHERGRIAASRNCSILLFKWPRSYFPYIAFSDVCPSIVKQSTIWRYEAPIWPFFREASKNVIFALRCQDSTMLIINYYEKAFFPWSDEILFRLCKTYLIFSVQFANIFAFLVSRVHFLTWALNYYARKDVNRLLWGNVLKIH